MKIIILQAAETLQTLIYTSMGKTGKLINLGFPQCKMIIVPLIFQSPVPLSLVVGVAFAVLSDVLSAPLFLVDVFSFIVHTEFSSRRSRSGGVSVENLPGWGFGATCCACVSFAWEIDHDSPIVNRVRTHLESPWKSLKFKIKSSRPWKSLKIVVGAGKSLNFGANFIQPRFSST